MVTPLSPVQEQKEYYFPQSTHPYRLLREVVGEHLSDDTALLDIGCGRKAPVLREFAGQGRSLIGVDLVDFPNKDKHTDILLYNASVASMPFLDDESIDIAYSRSVMEHVEDVEGAYQELYRVLKPGGQYIFLTPNKWDYVAIGARLIPNRFHPRLVRLTSGRAEEDVFPTIYRSNTHKDISRLAAANGFQITRFEYLTQYPAYLTFNRPLFWLGCHYERLLGRFESLSGLRGWIFCILKKPENHQ
ncbi:class I SAM-dependent methyltransferase [Ectothiorhodospira sp. BSL-9]|uniref:class I SAM-dependent methyltransferase n=1 Tax=Ectothiorhodospira sp. BSL-9 TaxID=1442136 RepID=UPI0007B456F4|nr:class I SAM-dependent methyltransferase [Ectothiorhodospira sp. BSL-9]ANB02211.1 hypothetical protein ECTOBSL9_1548 [Ectothiorhodospira sp. BSL-9]